MLQVPAIGAGGHLPWIGDSYIPTAGQITFILSQAPSDLESFRFYVNGVLVEDTNDYTVSGVTVTWLDSNYIMAVTDTVTIHYQ